MKKYFNGSPAKNYLAYDRDYKYHLELTYLANAGLIGFESVQAIVNIFHKKIFPSALAKWVNSRSYLESLRYVRWCLEMSLQSESTF